MNRTTERKKEPGTTEGDRRPTEVVPGATATTETCARPKRWTASRKRDVVLRIFRGESLADLSRELGVEIYRLEEWREAALNGLEEGLKARAGDPLRAELNAAKKHIGELSMENELLRERCRRRDSFRKGKSRR